MLLGELQGAFINVLEAFQCVLVVFRGASEVFLRRFKRVKAFRDV